MKPFTGSDAGPDPEPGRGRAAVWDRVAWAVGDQALASATNIGTAVVAARALDAEAFGAFGMAFAVYVLAVGGCRAAVTEPLVSLHSASSATSLRPVMRAATGAAVALGLGASAAVLAAAAVVGSHGGRAFAALAVVLPGLLLQDAWRYCFVTAGRPRDAVVNDAIWCTTQAGLLVVLALAGRLTLVGVILWWGGSGVVAGLAGCRQAAMLPELAAARRWLAEHRRLGGRYTMEFATAAGATQATLLGLGSIAGLAALGGVRGAQVFFGPINVVFGGIYLALAAEGGRLRSEPRRLRRLMVTASGALVTVGAAWLAVGLVLPARTGRSLFGATWAASEDVLLPVGLAVVGGGAAAGAIAGLRALAAARQSLRARLVGLPVVLAVPVGAAFAGPRAFAVGLAVATWAGAGIWWWHFAQALAEHPPAGTAEDTARAS
jgi:hypothetical protein